MKNYANSFLAALAACSSTTSAETVKSTTPPASTTADVKSPRPVGPLKLTRVQWTGIELGTEEYKATHDLMKGVFGFYPVADVPGFSVFITPEGQLVELYGPTAPQAPWRTGKGAVAFGFDSEDIDAAAAELGKQGIELIKQYPRSENFAKIGITLKDGIHTVPKAGAGGGDYRYAFFRAPDGRVYALSQRTPK